MRPLGPVSPCLVITVPMTEDDEGTSTVTACRNGQCETGRLKLWRGKQGRPLSLYAGGAGFEGGDRFSSRAVLAGGVTPARLDAPGACC